MTQTPWRNYFTTCSSMTKIHPRTSAFGQDYFEAQLRVSQQHHGWTSLPIGSYLESDVRDQVLSIHYLMSTSIYSVKQAIIDKKIVVNASEYPRFVYPDCECDAADIENGLFYGILGIKVCRVFKLFFVHLSNVQTFARPAKSSLRRHHPSNTTRQSRRPVRTTQA